VTGSADLPTVFVVEDDGPVRVALGRLLTAAGFNVQTYGSAEELILGVPRGFDGCLVLDLHLPGMTGLALHAYLKRGGRGNSVVFITADHELAISEEVRRTGVPCLGKPLDEAALLLAIFQVTPKTRS
jgi:FixJ family two-component response regulator